MKFHTPNPDHVFDIYGKHSHEQADIVRTSLIDYITCDPVTFKERMVVVLTMLHLTIDEWLLHIKDPKSPADEAVVYGLCQLYSRHALAYTTGSVWSTLEIHGKCSLADVKRHCDIHLVFLEGGMLGQLHRKPSIPKLISASTPLPKTKTRSESCTDTTVTANNDHTYSSPTPHPIPVSETPGKPTSDHTYAENSDVPTEPYGSDSDSKLDAVSTGITSGGRLIVASTDKLEISVEYPNSATLLEETGMTQNASEMLLDASNAGIVCPNSTVTASSLLLDEPTDHEALLEATTGTECPIVPLSDETNKILPDAPTDTETSPVATDKNDHAKELLQDETQTLLPEATDSMLPDKTNQSEPKT